MKINKEGYKIIAVSGVCLAAVWALVYYMIEAHEHSWLIFVITALLLMFWFFIVSFFREPRRIKIHDVDLVFSPCDGRVVVTEVVEDDEYFHGKRLQVSIFMSVTNVHINWFPVGGIVKYFKYHPGRFLVAWHPKSSTENERTTTVVETRKGVEVLFRQIAGIVARRIVSYVKVDEEVHQNDKCGFIKFGSRIDILLPENAELLVEIGDRDVGTLTPIPRIGDIGVEEADDSVDEQ